MRLSAMVWSFVPGGGPPKNLGRRARDLANLAVGTAGSVVAVATTVGIVAIVTGPSAVINTLMDAITEGGGRE